MQKKDSPSFCGNLSGENCPLSAIYYFPRVFALLISTSRHKKPPGILSGLLLVYQQIG
jgi:hypothetical protein